MSKLIFTDVLHTANNKADNGTIADIVIPSTGKKGCTHTPTKVSFAYDSSLKQASNISPSNTPAFDNNTRNDDDDDFDDTPPDDANGTDWWTTPNLLLSPQYWTTL